MKHIVFPGFEDVLGRPGIADALDQVRDAGSTQFIGFTALGDVDVLHELVANGRFDTLQTYHHVLNHSPASPGLSSARRTPPR
jgi:predicted aldo/keto reductase-like oxidoreductase